MRRKQVWGKVQNSVLDMISLIRSEVLNDSHCFDWLPTVPSQNPSTVAQGILSPSPSSYPGLWSWNRWDWVGQRPSGRFECSRWWWNSCLLMWMSCSVTPSPLLALTLQVCSSHPLMSWLLPPHCQGCSGRAGGLPAQSLSSKAGPPSRLLEDPAPASPSPPHPSHFSSYAQDPHFLARTSFFLHPL